jgi:hypothetical protein
MRSLQELSIPHFRNGRSLPNVSICELLQSFSSFPLFRSCLLSHRETKVVNSWFQNKRASMRKKAQRVEPDTVPPPTLPVPSVATISASESLATDSDAPAFPSEPHHPSLPPRSHHPSLPPIANLLRGSPPHTMSGADSDAEDDNMAVQLPPIREDNFTRPAFLSPTLAAVCLPNALTASTAVMIHQPT